MQPSLIIGRNTLILLTKSLSTFAVALLLTTSNLQAENSLKPEINLTVAEQYLLAAANEARATEGLSPVRLDPVLTEASAAHAAQRPKIGSRA